MASRGMNTFVYAPKDDPRMRRDWRAAYEGVDLRRLERAREPVAGRRRGPHVLRLARTDDALLRRGGRRRPVRQAGAVAELGVAGFGLLFDDIPPDLQHDADREAFDTLADAHVAVANQVYERLERGTRLTVCPTVYSGIGAEPYLAILGAGLEPGIDVFWTGRATCSPDPRRPRRGDLRADRPPARDLLGQLPGQRRLDELRAAHRALPRARPAPVPARVRRGRATAWSCSRRRRSRSRRSRTT